MANVTASALRLQDGGVRNVLMGSQNPLSSRAWRDVRLARLAASVGAPEDATLCPQFRVAKERVGQGRCSSGLDVALRNYG